MENYMENFDASELLASGPEIFFIRICLISLLIDFDIFSPQHKVLEDCRLPYNKFEPVLDKIAEIT